MTWNVTGNLSLMLHSPYTILRIREPPVLVSQGLLYSTLKFAKKKKNSVEICCKNQDCVVPENIYTPSPSPPPTPFTEGNGTSEGRGSKRRQFLRGWGGWPLQSFFRGFQVRLMSKLSPILLYFGVSKQKIIVFSRWYFICSRLTTFFHGLARWLM